MPMALAAMGILALLKLSTELHRLLLSTGYTGAIDLRLRQEEVQRWFADLPVYSELGRIVYPPEAYVLLWPLLGWTSWSGARWVWAITSLAALAWLTILFVRGSGAETRRERLFIVLMVLSMNAVGVTIGNGQLILHLLPALVAVPLLLAGPDGGVGRDAIVALLLLITAIKPTLAGPFIWVILLAARHPRPLVFAAFGYVAATLLALGFQSAPLSTLVAEFRLAAGRGIGDGYGDVDTALFALGFGGWSEAVAVTIVLALGLWTFRHRRADIWILLGVAALVARFWTYHRVYDDVLILVPMVALFRVAKLADRDRGTDVLAGVLLAASVIAMLAPARMEKAGAPLSWIFVFGHVAVWLAMLGFLLWVARRDSSLGHRLTTAR